MLAGVALVAAFVLRAWRTPSRRSSTCGCSRTAASPPPRRTVFLVGAALFGALLLLPLYFQIARGQSPLEAGLLMAPQGARARRSGMNRAGRLTDRVGGGRVVIAGLLVLMLGTVPFTQVAAGHVVLAARGRARRARASAWASR